MANLAVKDGVYIARFRYAGKEYKRSLHTKSAKDAKTAMHEVERALHRLAINLLQLPDGVDPGDFIVSGGTLQPPDPKEERPPVPSLTAAVAEYLNRLGHLAESHRYTIGIHLNNLKKHLGDRAEHQLDRIGFAELDDYQQVRLAERANTTVAKERQSIIAFFDWAVTMRYLSSSPAANLDTVPESRRNDRFRTTEEIEAKLARGGLNDDEIQAAWKCLYLTTEEIANILAIVKSRCRKDVSYLLHAVPAYTGMRRGELLRLRWDDVEFDRSNIIARSTKQSRQEVETHRDIELHAELREILMDWRTKRPKGQFVICDPGCLEALTPRLANGRFWQPLRGTTWCLDSRKNLFKIGFHTYRHSFASNYAAIGTDQGMIDAWMGHQTKAMRKRYRHLFPQRRRSGMNALSLATVATEQQP